MYKFMLISPINYMLCFKANGEEPLYQKNSTRFPHLLSQEAFLQTAPSRPQLLSSISLNKNIPKNLRLLQK